MLERPWFFWRRAFGNLRQNPVLCSAAIGTVAVALTILAAFAVVVVNVQEVARRWSGEVQVVAYLEEPPPAIELERLQDELEGLPEVGRVEYVPRERAWEEFRQRLGEEADLVEGLGPEVLPASLRLHLKEEFRHAAGVEKLVDRLRERGGLEDLDYGEQWLQRFGDFLTLLRLVGIILGAFLLFSALFIVANTIKITLYARQDELEIMGLVGATPLFIKTPYLLEGALQGLIGGLAALGLSLILFRLILYEGLRSLLGGQGAEILFLPPPFQVGLVLLGMLLGFTGSLFALRRFVRV